MHIEPAQRDLQIMCLGCFALPVHNCAYIALFMLYVAAKGQQRLMHIDVVSAPYVLQIDVLYTLQISGMSTFARTTNACIAWQTGFCCAVLCQSCYCTLWLPKQPEQCSLANSRKAVTFDLGCRANGLPALEPL